MACEIFAICINEWIPSCIRAPPEAVTSTTGSWWAVAYSNRRVIFSPATVPNDPMMNSGSMIPKANGVRPIVAFPVKTASLSCVCAWAAVIFSI